MAKDRPMPVWRPIAEAHEDYGLCVYINIHAPGNVVIAHVCDLDYDDNIAEMTHFAMLPPLTDEIFDQLTAHETNGAAKEKSRG
jgi:hypothetical protein